MTKINDYLWHLPHEALPDDPPDVGMLQQSFNGPLVAALEEPLGALGYELKSNDVLVNLESQLDLEPGEEGSLKDTYLANVRFIAYLTPDIILRVHFEHAEWAHFLPEHETHTYFINLDRFKVQDPRTQIAVPAWSGRLHTRMSNTRGDELHHNGEDQIWSFASAEALESQLQLFLDKFHRLGDVWLRDASTL